MSANRRQAPRMGREIPIRYRASAGWETGLAYDVSSTGARIVLNHAIPAPTEMTLDLDPPLQVEARAVWQRGRTFGVRFTTDSPQLQSWLEDQAAEALGYNQQTFQVLRDLLS